jgi:hypothetical protein
MPAERRGGSRKTTSFSPGRPHRRDNSTAHVPSRSSHRPINGPSAPTPCSAESPKLLRDRNSYACCEPATCSVRLIRRMEFPFFSSSSHHNYDVRARSVGLSWTRKIRLAWWCFITAYYHSTLLRSWAFSAMLHPDQTMRFSQLPWLMLAPTQSVQK